MAVANGLFYLAAHLTKYIHFKKQNRTNSKALHLSHFWSSQSPVPHMCLVYYSRLPSAWYTLSNFWMDNERYCCLPDPLSHQLKCFFSLTLTSSSTPSPTNFSDALFSNYNSKSRVLLIIWQQDCHGSWIYPIPSKNHFHHATLFLKYFTDVTNHKTSCNWCHP